VNTDAFLFCFCFHQQDIVNPDGSNMWKTIHSQVRLIHVNTSQAVKVCILEVKVSTSPFQIWCKLYLYRKRAFTVKYGYSVRFQEWSYLTGAFTSWKCAQTNPSNRQTPSGMLRNTSRISLIVSIATLTSFKSFCRFLSYQILCIFVNVFTFFSRENILISWRGRSKRCWKENRSVGSGLQADGFLT